MCVCCGCTREIVRAFYRVFACITFAPKKIKTIINAAHEQRTRGGHWIYNIDRRPQRERACNHPTATMAVTVAADYTRSAVVCDIMRVTTVSLWRSRRHIIGSYTIETNVACLTLLLLISLYYCYYYYYYVYYALFTPIIAVCMIYARSSLGAPWNARDGMCRRFGYCGRLTC